ncbi:MAG: hypothetical protein GXP62_11390, partial [Oligoflexia bacterium]|nr:hypothetical protein [Oligoflexia bacterium]
MTRKASASGRCSVGPTTAAGRRRSVDAIRPHAEGRVWTGRQALDRGLVDHLGSLADGVARARVLAGLPEDAPVRHVRFPPPRFRILSQLLGRQASLDLAPQSDLLGLALASLGPAGLPLRLLRSHPGQALAVLPWVVDEAGADD